MMSASMKSPGGVLKGLSFAVKGLKEHLAENTLKGFAKSARWMLGEEFEAQQDPYDEEWLPVTWRPDAHRLRWTYSMSRSFTYRVQGQKLTIGNRKHYFPVHQTGGTFHDFTDARGRSMSVYGFAGGTTRAGRHDPKVRGQRVHNPFHTAEFLENDAQMFLRGMGGGGVRGGTVNIPQRAMLPYRADLGQTWTTGFWGAAEAAVLGLLKGAMKP